MRVRLTIGDFSRMTHLSVKALRHYHDVGVLEPAEIDPASGYRFYEPSQVPVAQVIRRFRDLGMPLDEIKGVLQAPDLSARSRLVASHLERMESHLVETQSVVASLRALLERPSAPISVEHRSVGPVQALTISELVSMADLDMWWDEAFRELDTALAASAVRPIGPRAALYSTDYFALETGGLVVAYVPVADEVSARGRTKLLEIPPAELAVAVHTGTFADLDRTYGALGTYVAEREIGVDGPIREYYLVSPFDTHDQTKHVTEVCWPVFQTTRLAVTAGRSAALDPPVMGDPTVGAWTGGSPSSSPGCAKLIAYEKVGRPSIRERTKPRGASRRPMGSPASCGSSCWESC